MTTQPAPSGLERFLNLFTVVRPGRRGPRCCSR